MSEEARIICMLKGVSKCESIVSSEKSALVSLVLVLVVVYAFADSVPTNTLFIFYLV